VCRGITRLLYLQNFYDQRKQYAATPEGKAVFAKMKAASNATPRTHYRKRKYLALVSSKSKMNWADPVYRTKTLRSQEEGRCRKQFLENECSGNPVGTMPEC
jgi:hypothetical protein